MRRRDLGPRSVSDADDLEVPVAQIGPNSEIPCPSTSTQGARRRRNPPKREPPRERIGRAEKKRKRKADASNTWMWWAGGVGVGLIVAIIAMVLIANSGDEAKQAVIFYAVSLGIMVPISTVILVISMFVASSLGGGIDFGAAHTAIIKAICLLVAVNVVGMLPFGIVLVFPIWLLGLMYLFGLDLWEARFLIFINWFLNTAAKFFLVVAFVGYILHGKHSFDDDSLIMSSESSPSTPESRAIDGLEKLDADIETADEIGSPVVKVDLSGKRFADKDVDLLAPLTKIRELNLAQTQITDAGLAKLKPLKNLFILNVTGTKVTNAGVQELKKTHPQINVTR